MFTGKTKPHKLNKNDIIDQLHSSGVVAKGCEADIVSKAKENEIVVEENEHDNKEGLIVKPKGVLQVLW